MGGYINKQKKRNRTSLRLPYWMEHQCKRVALFESKSTSKIIREAIIEYLENKDFGYAEYLKIFKC